MGNNNCVPGKDGENLVDFLRRKFKIKSKKKQIDDLVAQVIREELQNGKTDTRWNDGRTSKLLSKDKSNDSGFTSKPLSKEKSNDSGFADNQQTSVDVKRSKGGMAFVFDFNDDADNGKPCRKMSCLFTDAELKQTTKCEDSAILVDLDEGNLSDFEHVDVCDIDTDAEPVDVCDIDTDAEPVDVCDIDTDAEPVDVCDIDTDVEPLDSGTTSNSEEQDGGHVTYSPDFDFPSRNNSIRRWKPDIEIIPISKQQEFEEYRARIAKQREMTRELMRSRKANSALFMSGNKALDIDNDISKMEDDTGKIKDIGDNAIPSRSNAATSDYAIADVISPIDTPRKTEHGNGLDTSIEVARKKTSKKIKPKLPGRITTGCRQAAASPKTYQRSHNDTKDAQIPHKDVKADVLRTPRAEKGMRDMGARNETAKDTAPAQTGPDRNIVWPVKPDDLTKQEKLYYVQQFQRTELFRQRLKRKIQGSNTWMNGLTPFQLWVIQYDGTMEMEAVFNISPKRPKNNAHAKVSCWRGRTPPPQ